MTGVAGSGSAFGHGHGPAPDSGRARGWGRGHGKLLLFGEHAAVYGHPAVGIALPEILEAVLEPRGPAAGDGLWLPEGLPAPERARVAEALDLAVKLRPDLTPPGPCRVRLRSRIPSGLGFGSSAALCVALSAALHDLRGAPAERGSIWALAHGCETVFHGTPSGIDTGLALLGGLAGFLPHPPGLPEARILNGFPLPLVIGAVPRSHGTGALVAGIRRKVLAGEEATLRRLSELGEIAGRAAALLDGPAPESARRLAALGDFCLRAAALLGELGLSTPEIDALLAAGRAAGALGGKLSGAGGGGAFFLLFPDPRERTAALEPLRRSAATLGLPRGAYLRPVDAGPSMLEKNN